MHDERLTTADASLDAAPRAEPLPTAGRARDRRARRIVVGLTGLLGAAWAMVIASRFTGLLPS